MTVEEILEILQHENKDLKVFAMVNESCREISSVEVYEDAVEFWTGG